MTKRHSPKVRPPPAAVKNLLLLSLSHADRERILPTLDVIPLKLKHMLHKPGEPVDHIYFPGGGFCSVVTVLEDGSMVEVATVGREGMVGGLAALEHNVAAPSATMVQGEADVCYRMTARAFRHEMERRGPFYSLMTRYMQAFVGFVMQSTACNAAHTVEQRLARWLLTAQDRMDAAEFPLTQEFVAMMLGASRTSVTVVAGTLQKAGLITYRRGRVAILNRAKLERASCECYRAAKNLLQSVTARKH